MVGYVKHHFFQRYRRFESWAHLNQQLQAWLLEVADQRVHGTVHEVVSERFRYEQARLQRLSPFRFDTAYRERRRVALDAYIDVRANRYSVPAHLAGGWVTAHIGLDGGLKVFDLDEHLVATHRLQTPDQGWQVDPQHHARLWKDSFQVQTRELERYQELS